MANTYVKIASVTVGSGGSNTITFSSIPSTYTDLVIKLSGRSTGTSANWTSINVKPNGSTSSSNRVLYGNGSSVSSYSSSSGTGTVSSWNSSATTTSSTFANVEIYIPNYTSSNYKSVYIDVGTENNGASALIALVGFLYESTSSITSLTLESTAGEGDFTQYSTAVLYGISKS